VSDEQVPELRMPELRERLVEAFDDAYVWGTRDGESETLYELSNAIDPNGPLLTFEEIAALAKKGYGSE